MHDFSIAVASSSEIHQVCFKGDNYLLGFSNEKSLQIFLFRNAVVRDRFSRRMIIHEVL